MLALEVKGKSTRGIRGVYVLVDAHIQKAIERLLVSRPPGNPASDYLFAR
jgi:hypothetical protein